MDQKIKTINNKGQILAIVYKGEGSGYLSPSDFPMQVGILDKKKNEKIDLHEHPRFEKLENLSSQEVLYIEKGKIKVGVYENEKKKLFCEEILYPGDLIILNSPHEVNILEDSKIIIIKQGPYSSENKQFLKTDI
jgi:hypothetical protein